MSNWPCIQVRKCTPALWSPALSARRRRVFEREAGWQHGALLESNLISESEDRLSTLPYVAALDTALLLGCHGRHRGLVSGREGSRRSSRRWSAWLCARRGQDPSGYWAGELDLELASAFGDGRNIALNVARPDPASQRTRVNYWEPWPWGVPVWLGLDLGQEDFGSDFIETKASLRTRLATHQPRWQFSATWGRVTLEEDPSPDTYPAEYLQAGIAAYRFQLLLGLSL